MSRSESDGTKNTANVSGRSLNIEALIRARRVCPPLIFGSASRAFCPCASRSVVAPAYLLMDFGASKHGLHFWVTERASAQRRNFTKWPYLAQIAGICLECAAIFGHQPLTIRCRLGVIQG
jgi:hypothetical protein